MTAHLAMLFYLHTYKPDYRNTCAQFWRICTFYYIYIYIFIKIRRKRKLSRHLFDYVLGFCKRVLVSFPSVLLTEQHDTCKPFFVKIM